MLPRTSQFTPDELRQWERAQDERHFYVSGEVFAMAGVFRGRLRLRRRDRHLRCIGVATRNYRRGDESFGRGRGALEAHGGSFRYEVAESGDRVHLARIGVPISVDTLYAGAFELPGD